MNFIEDPIEITQLRKQLFLDYLNWILKQLELDPIENITDFYIDRPVTRLFVPKKLGIDKDT